MRRRASFVIIHRCRPTRRPWQRRPVLCCCVCVRGLLAQALGGRSFPACSPRAPRVHPGPSQVRSSAMVSIKLDDGREVVTHDIMLTDVVGEWLKSKFLVKTKNDDVALMVEDTMLDTQKTFEEQQIQEGKVLKVMSKGQALAIAIGGKGKKASSDGRAADEAKKQEAAKVVAREAMAGGLRRRARSSRRRQRCRHLRTLKYGDQRLAPWLRLAQRQTCWSWSGVL